MASHVQFALALLTTCFTISTFPYQMPHKKFEYKHSFKGPHLVSKDGTVPFWEHLGHAIASDESIRVTPSLRSKKGAVWNKIKNTNQFWEVEMKFRVSGRGRIGADGLAFWYTDERGKEGPVFGNIDQWKGLAVFFDSFDNDAQHNNPYIMGMVNDGTKKYDHNSDGSHQQLGGCLRDFRNKPFPVRAKIEYYQRVLQIYFHTGTSNNEEDYELCMRADNVDLPKEGYFGVTAATGGLADDHDVLAILTHSLAVPAETAKESKVTDEEKKKLEKEFDEYWDKLQKAKEEYRKEHPEKKTEDESENEEKWFEDQKERELKQIYTEQNQMHNTMKELHKKLDMIIGQQERTLSQVNTLSTGGGAVQGGTGGGQVVIDTIKRHEVDELMRTIRESHSQVNNMKALVDVVHTKTVSGGGGAGGGNFDNQLLNHEMRDNLNSVKNDVTKLLNKPPQGPVPQECPAQNCISSTLFLIIIAAQTTIFIGYMIYKGSKDAAMKKFY